MEALTIRDFKNRMGGSLDRAIVPVSRRDAISPALAAQIEQARKDFKEGLCIPLRTSEDIDKYFGT